MEPTSSSMIRAFQRGHSPTYSQFTCSIMPPARKRMRSGMPSSQQHMPHASSSPCNTQARIDTPQATTAPCMSTGPTGLVRPSSAELGTPLAAQLGMHMVRIPGPISRSVGHEPTPNNPPWPTPSRTGLVMPAKVVTDKGSLQWFQLLTAIVRPDGKNWDDMLPFVQYALNTAADLHTRLAPYFMMFARYPYKPDSFITP